MSAAAASTVIQDAHIRHAPTVEDIAPSTAADKKIPLDTDSIDDDDDDVDSISSSLLDAPAAHHRRNLPPLPDLRFEQSYLASIRGANGVWWKIALITAREQVLMPLVQGVAMNLLVLGWRRWNRAVKFSGNSVGARVRRWWYDVNKWELPMK